jgi:putative transposase
MQLSKPQIKSLLANFASSEGGGLQGMMELCLEACMKAEREEHLQSDQGVTDKGNGYRNVKTFGRGKMLELRVPRTRNGNFYPIILGLIKDQEEESRKLAFELYTKGLTTDQVGDVFERLYGKHFSKASVSRMFDYAREEVKYWLERELEAYYPIVYIDATFWSTRRDTKVSKEAYYTVLGVKSDCTREVLGIYNFPTESASGWKDVMENLQKRGLNEIGLVVADGLRGLDTAIASVFSGTEFQKCSVHLARNVQGKIKPEDKKEMAADLKAVFRKDIPDDTPEQGWERFENLITKWEKKYPSMKVYRNKLEYFSYFTYLGYHEKVRSMIYSTNWIERLNRDYKRTLRMRGAMPDAESVILLCGNVAMTRKAYDYKVPHLETEQIKFRWGESSRFSLAE